MSWHSTVGDKVRESNSCSGQCTATALARETTCPSHTVRAGSDRDHGARCTFDLLVLHVCVARPVYETLAVRFLAAYRKAVPSNWRGP